MPENLGRHFRNFLNVILTSIFLLLFAVLLSGCNLLSTSRNDQAITLKFWGLWEPATIMNQIINDYKKVKPNVDIIYEKKSIQQYRESLESQIESNKGPDIFLLHNTWTPMLKEELAVVPSNVVSQSQFKKDFYPSVFYDLRNSEKQFVGVPLEVDGLALYWNEDIFQAAGITSPPETWTEFAQIASKLTVKDQAGNIKTAGAAMGTANNVDHFSDILGMMILQNGGDPKLPTDKATADALNYYVNFTKGPSRVWDETMPSSTIAFAGGNLAMYFGPSWRAIEIKNTTPFLNFKVAPVPQLEGGKVTWASYWAVGVSANGQNKDQAWQFVKHLVEDQTLTNLYREASKTRFFGEPYPKVSLGATLASDPIVGAYISDAPFARSFPMASRTFDNGLNDQIIKAYEDAVNSVLRGTPTDQALDTTAKNVANILARFGAN